MIVPKIAVCPVCGKKTYLRIECGGYLSEYPIRVNCINCKTLIKGTFIMSGDSIYRGLHLFNAKVEECDVDKKQLKIKNADFIAEISGELPCKNAEVFDGNVRTFTPFLDSVDKLKSSESIIDRNNRLSYFAKNMEDWKQTKSIAFQLLEEGSIEYVSMALHNKMGDYKYICDNYLKSMHCLQEVVLNETKYLFAEDNQENYIFSLIKSLASINKETLHRFAEEVGGIESLIISYRKVIEVISDFMNIYPNILPAETFIRYENKDASGIGIATCSFSDIKTFYQDAYESLLSLLYFPVCLDNIELRGDYLQFNENYNDVLSIDNKKNFNKQYRKLDNGTRINKLNENEYYQRIIELPANRNLRNGIGHNNIKYDGITQTITAFDLKNPNKVKFQSSLINVAADCIGLAKSAVILSEIILFVLREEFRNEEITTIVHPRLYKNVKVNDPCPCGSGKKYKKCCERNVESMLKDNGQFKIL